MELNREEVLFLRKLRDKGYAVVVFTEEELDGAPQKRVEDRLVEVGWDIINDLK